MDAIRRIEELDPGDIIKMEVRAGLPQQQGVDAYAAATVAGLDDLLWAEGGSGVTVDDMVAYVTLIVEAR